MAIQFLLECPNWYYYRWGYQTI